MKIKSSSRENPRMSLRSVWSTVRTPKKKLVCLFRKIKVLELLLLSSLFSWSLWLVLVKTQLTTSIEMPRSKDASVISSFLTSLRTLVFKTSPMLSRILVKTVCPRSFTSTAMLSAWSLNDHMTMLKISISNGNGNLYNPLNYNIYESILKLNLNPINIIIWVNNW